MGVFDALHRRVDDLRHMPGVRQLRKAAYDRRFESAREAHLFRGVFASFEQAVAAAPSTAAAGYDNPVSAELYVGEQRPTVFDYPAFFWLAQSISDGAASIADLGGNVGFKCLALRSLMALPPGLRWLVIDVPEVIRRGQQLQQQNPGHAGVRLEFSSNVTDSDGIDVLYASGALQYLPVSLEQIIGGLRRPPRRIVVNTTPLHASRSFFTLNSIGSAYCPYRVQSRSDFEQGAARMGYGVRDSWLNPGKSMHIPFVEGHDVPDYSGYCLEREAAG
jgi:putative methyltransferase (TIGR04325 family)